MLGRQPRQGLPGQRTGVYYRPTHQRIPHARGEQRGLLVRRAIAHRAPGAPVPSTTVPPRITTSTFRACACSAGTETSTDQAARVIDLRFMTAFVERMP